MKKTRLPTHCTGARGSVTPNAFQHALLAHSIQTPPEEKLVVTGPHTGAAQAARQLREIEYRVLTTQQVLFAAAQNIFPKLFLLCCVGSKALEEVAE